MPEPEPLAGDDPGMARLERERSTALSIESDRPLSPGRLTPRQRLAALLDDGSFLELGALANSQQPGATAPTPGDGVVTGFGAIDGDQVAVMSEDPWLLARTDGQVAKSKRRRLLKLALQQRLPIVLFADGPTLPRPVFPATGGHLIGGIAEQYDDADLHGREAPLIGVVLGPATGQTGELLAESDVLVASAEAQPNDGSEIDADVVVANDTEAVLVARALLRLDGSGHGSGPKSTGGLAGVPASDDIGAELADPGTWMAFARDRGSGLISGILAVGGIPMAVAVTGAGGQRLLGGDDLGRLRRIVAISGRFSMPLLLVQDCDGYAPGLMDDRSSAAALADLIAGLRALTAPIVSLVTGAGHVLGTFCLGGRQVDPSYILAWPWADIGVTDTPAYDAQSLGAYRQRGPWLAAGLGLVDDVITPEETGPWLRWFAALYAERRHLPPIAPDRRWYARSSIKGT
jgi:acetyl-CoA carboxylase carboxyltransferase component